MVDRSFVGASARDISGANDVVPHLLVSAMERDVLHPPHLDDMKALSQGISEPLGGEEVDVADPTLW